MTIGLLKQALHALRHESFGRVPLWVHRWFKWLVPGLLVKRWLVLSAVGVFLATIGFAIWLKLTPVFYTTQFVGFILTEVAETVPSYISGPLAMASGLLLVWWGQARTLNSITEALMPEGDEALVDVLIAHRRLHRGPRVVVIGGGTGLSNLLRGLKHYSANITAVVTVADDGGSSGRLRREIGVLPPGDIRNCLTALADEEKLMTELFRYRFQAGDGLSGHSFGNLFLTAMSEITGDLEQAIAASSRVLAVRGQVLPATLEDVCLWAELTDGRRVEGESNITEAGGAIARIGCKPANPPALPKAVKAIQEADFIVIGPGSLYTSIIPNLLVPEIADAIAQSKAPRIYVCNIMTQEGETQGYSVGDHIRAIDRACGRRLFEAVLVQKQSPSAKALIRYAKQNSNPVPIDRDVIGRLGRRVILANVMQENEETGQLRHNPYALAKVLMRWFARVQ